MKKAASYKTLEAKRTDYDIPTFGYRSALVLLLGGVVGTIIFPLFLSIFGVNTNFGVLIGNTFITSFSIAYSRYFIETKKGYCKSFWLSYAFFAFSFGVMSYLWTYMKFFI